MTLPLLHRAGRSTRRRAGVTRRRHLAHVGVRSAPIGPLLKSPAPCQPPSSSRSSAARPSPTRTGSGASPGGSPASGPPARSSSSSSPRWATRPTSCSPSRPPITDEPDERELDMLLATGEHQSATLVSMALHALGVAAISLTGAQAGITTDGRYGKARIANVDPQRVREELDDGKVVIVAGFQGLSPRATSRRRTRPRPSAAAAPTRPPSRSPPRLDADRCQIFTDVRGIYTADPRIVPDARQLTRHRLRGDARARPPGRPGHADPGGRARLGQRRRHRGPQLVRGRARHPDHGGPARGAAQQGPRPRPRPQRRQDHARRRAGPAGRRARTSSSRWPRPASTST